MLERKRVDDLLAWNDSAQRTRERIVSRVMLLLGIIMMGLGGIYYASVLSSGGEVEASPLREGPFFFYGVAMLLAHVGLSFRLRERHELAEAVKKLLRRAPHR